MSTSPLLTGVFWAAAFERAIKTIAQSALSMVIVDQTSNIFSIRWETVAGVSLTAAVISLLMSIVSIPIGPEGSPSMVPDRPVVNSDPVE